MLTPTSFETTCDDLSLSGAGVTKHPNGKIVFVNGAWPGDRLVVEVTKWEKKFGFGLIKEIIQPSPDRQTPPCPYLTEQNCGGCSWMIVRYERQLFYKQTILKKAFERAKIFPLKLAEIQGTRHPYAYRTRAQFKTDGDKLGFIAKNSHDLIDVSHCLVLNEACQKLLTELRQKLPNSSWRPTKKWQKWHYIDIEDQPKIGPLSKRLPFKQGNAEQNAFMRHWLKNQLKQMDANRSVLELFCGSGNLTETLAEHGFQHIAAVEAISEATDALQSKSLTNVKIHQLDLYKKGFANHLSLFKESSVLVLDPPRSGFPELHTTVDSLPNLEHVLYISCDLNSFIRDIQKLNPSEWTLQEVQPLDMFPQTPHIEILSSLSKRSN